jgi:hypothetical protein
MADGLPERFPEGLAEVSRGCASLAAGGRGVSRTGDLRARLRPSSPKKSGTHRQRGKRWNERSVTMTEGRQMMTVEIEGLLEVARRQFA